MLKSILLALALGTAQLRAGDGAEQRLRFLRALQDLQQKHYPAAKAGLLGLLAEQPGDARLNFYFGRLCYEEGKMDLAARYLQRAADLNPGMPATHLYLGKVAFKIGSLEAAKAELNAALALDDQLAEPHWLLSQLEAKQGNSKQAKAHRAAALKLDPGLKSGTGRKF